MRLEFRAASAAVWIELVHLLGLRWKGATLGHLAAGRLVQRLRHLARLRCRSQERPLPAGAVAACLLDHVSTGGRVPVDFVERSLMRALAGETLSGCTAAEITGLIEAFLRCYAGDYERGKPHVASIGWRGSRDQGAAAFPSRGAGYDRGSRGIARQPGRLDPTALALARGVGYWVQVLGVHFRS